MERLSEDQLDRLLSAREVLDHEAVAAALVEMRNSSTASSSRSVRALPRGARKPIRRLRWAAPSLAVGVCVAALVVAGTITGGAGGSHLPLSVQSAEAAQLHKLARAAAAQPSAGSGQWEYYEVTPDPSSGASFTQHWVGGNGLERQRGVIHGKLISDFVQPSPFAAYDNLQVTDAQGLLAYIAAHAEAQPISLANSPDVFWDVLEEILTNSTSAQLRSVAFAALADVPGTKVTGSQTDQLGRSGTAISFTEPARVGSHESFTLVVSASTGQILEAYQTLTAAENGQPAGTVLSPDLFVDQAIVDSDTALPDGGTQPLTSATEGVTTTTDTTATATSTTATK